MLSAAAELGASLLGRGRLGTVMAVISCRLSQSWFLRCFHYLTSDEACANVPRSYAGQGNPQPKLVNKLNPKGTTDEEVTEVRHRPVVRGGVCRRRACR